MVLHALPTGPHPLAVFGDGSTFGTVVVLLFVVAGGALVLWFNFALVSTLVLGDGDPAAGKVNCQACGARTTADLAVCDYCGAPLGEAADGAS